jgi:NADP-dependent 3-hydroxy acid dehydrogenase YdfG
MGQLEGKVAWVTGAGTGIGEAGAKALAREGASVVLSGRRLEPLEQVARAIEGGGGRAVVEAGDMTDAARVTAISDAVRERFGRLDILVNNAGNNVKERSWKELNPERIDFIVDANLSSAFYCAWAALPMMRERKDGVLIHTASWAGRFVSAMTGPGYTAAKHAVVAMSHELNMEEFANGIRSTVLCPGEVATPILDRRPVPVSDDDKARMIQSEDMGEIILFVATRPKHIVLNEIIIGPTWNRGYLAANTRA